MTVCRECRAKVTKLAKTCPHCGADKPAYGNVGYGIHVLPEFLFGLLILGIVLIVLWHIFTAE